MRFLTPTFFGPLYYNKQNIPKGELLSNSKEELKIIKY
jgi:hypothetical protein